MDGDGVPATDINSYPSGISYTIDGLTLNINSSATDITTSTNIGVFLNATGSASRIIETLANTLTINTSGGPNHDGAMAKHDGTGAVTITSAAKINTSGFDGEGLVGWISNATNPESINNSGKIVTLGAQASGVYAYSVGTVSLQLIY